MVRVVILAAGKGSRMKTDIPKSAYPLFGISMIDYLIKTFHDLNINEIYTVVGYKKDYIKNLVKDKTKFIIQTDQKGTGSAVKSCESILKDKEGITIIIPSDMPLISKDIINDLINYHKLNNNDLTVVTTIIKDPKGYERIIRNNDKINKIIEEKDCNTSQLRIREINTGLYCIDNKKLFKHINDITNQNKQNEYYLTDIVEIFYNNRLNTDSFLINNDFRLLGINDLFTLSIVEKEIQKEINKRFLLNGIYISNPDSVLIHENVIIEKNCKIMPNTILKGNTIIKENSIIGPNTEIENSLIGCNNTIKNCIIINSEIEDNKNIKPFTSIINNRWEEYGNNKD